LNGRPVGHVEEMFDRQSHAFERRPDVAHVFDGPLHNLHLDCHYLPASAATRGLRSSARRRAISFGYILPYAGLMIRPRSRIANSTMISAMLRLPRIAAYIHPWPIPAALKPSITAAISTM